MNKKTPTVFLFVAVVLGLLFFLPNSVMDFLFQKSQPSLKSISVIGDVYGKVQKKNTNDLNLNTVTKEDSLSSGDTLYTHSDSKILLLFKNSFWLMPHSKMEFVKKNSKWVGNLVYGDIKKITEDENSNKPAIDIVYASQPIAVDVFSTYEFETIDLDIKTDSFKDSPTESNPTQNVIEKQIFQTLGQHKKFFQGCLIKHYKKTGGNFKSGETVFELKIDITGNIVNTHVVRSDNFDEDYKKCLKTVLERVRFRNLPLTEPMIALFPLSVEMPN